MDSVWGDPVVCWDRHPLLEVLARLGAAVLVDRHGRSRYVTEEACALAGYGREELLGLNFSHLFPRARLSRASALWRRVRVSGPRTLAVHLRNRDGRLFPVEIHARPFALEGDSFLLCLARELPESGAYRARRATGHRCESPAQWERAFPSLAENLPDNVVRYDKDGRIIYANRALCFTLGRTVEQLVGRGLDGLSDTEWGRVLREKVTASNTRTTPEEVKISIRTAAGEDQIHLVRFVTERDEDGNATGTLAIGRDITALELAAARLYERAEAFRTLADNLPDAVARYDVAERILYVNPTLCKAFGFQPEDVVGRAVNEIMPGTPWARDYKQKLAERNASVGSDELKITIRTAAGEEQVHQVRFVTEVDEQGRIAGTLAIGRDITALERASVLLHERAEAFRALVENSPDTIARFERNGRRVYINRGVGCSDDEAGVLGEVAPSQPSFGLPRIVNNVLRLGKMFEGEVPYFTATGEKRWERLRVVPEFGPDGTIVSALAIGHDITQSKVMEQHLKESRAEVRELAAMQEHAREEERKRLARELHDELGQALMALRLEIRIAEFPQGDGAEEKEARTGRILSLLDKTNRVIKDVIAALRPAALDGGLAPAVEWLTADFAERTGVTCTLDLQEQATGLDEGRAIALFRILQEALTNVMRHAAASQVLVRFERYGIDYRLSVRDNGVGFDPTQPRKKSFGLVGMRERALAVGGMLAVSSAPGQGTDVVVLIPVRKEREP